MYRTVFFTLPGLFLLLFSFIFYQDASAMPNAAQMPVLTGTVVETMDVTTYTYMLVKSDQGQQWVAIPKTPVKEGSTIHFTQGMILNNFKSNTLNRTFDSIMFSPGLADANVKTAPHSQQKNDSFSAAVEAEKISSQPAPPMPKSGGSAGAIVPFKEISIDKSTADNGYTVAEIFGQAKALNGKKVRVHAKVVKFSPNIMGRNWVHLQDGTGDPMQNSHDLVVTTAETVKIGSIITVEGILAAEKDFGAGYKYAAIVEKGTILK